MKVKQFNEKLNKIQGNVYTIEEPVVLVNGVYQAALKHDNVNEKTLAVYTGTMLTGDRITTFDLSTPSLAPWKRIIRIYASVPMVYISYEADGDTVEAEDVNNLQEEITRTQEALNTEMDRAQGAEADLQAAINAESGRAQSAESDLKNIIDANKPVWDDKYTRNEVDNKFSVLESAIDWKETVTTFTDISKTYPNPEDGWTVNVKDTDYTYRYSGSEWVVISANSIPKATQEVDGLLSKEDKILYDDTNSKKHFHSNISILDSITQALLSAWNSAVTHISDTVRHITAAERNNWNTAVTKLSDIAEWAQDIDTDTKNTAGSTNSTSKLFLIGAASQEANPQTYSRSVVYIGTDGCLYSNGTKVSVEGHTHEYVKKAPTWGELMGV